ncbi:MAG: hypothetical protein O3C21_13500 [Verrucomicrobia bacterium]|nr:hypothetical protein [Verrucomicrobiota bacterium]
MDRHSLSVGAVEFLTEMEDSVLGEEHKVQGPRVIAEGLLEPLGPEPPPEIPARLRRATRAFISNIDAFIQKELAA